jgi:WD40 repeat protein
VRLLQPLARLLISLCCLWPAGAHADEKADALLKEVVAKVRADLPLVSAYRVTIRQQEQRRAMQATLKKSAKESGFMTVPVPGAGGLAYQIWGLVPLAELPPLPTYFPFYPPSSDALPPEQAATEKRAAEKVAAENGFATRLLEPETLDGKRCEVVEVTNPFPVLSGGQPRLTNEIGIALQKGVARYYIGEDRRIRRITGDFTVSAKPENALKLPETSTLTVEILVSKIEKGSSPLTRPEPPPAARTLPLPEDSNRNVALLAPDGKTCLAGLRDGAITLYDTATGKSLRTLEGHLNPVIRLQCSADGTLLASQSDDGVVALWQLASGKLLRTHRHDQSPTLLALSPNGALLATSIAGKGVTVYRVSNGEIVATLPELLLAQLVFSPNGKTLAMVNVDGVVKLRDTATWKTLRDFEALREPPQPVGAVAFSPDGKTLAFGGEKGALEIWDATNGKRLRLLAGLPSEIVGLAFSPDGKTLAVADCDRERDFPGSYAPRSTAVTLWDTTTWKATQTIAVERNLECNGVAFLPDGKTLTKYGVPYRPLSFWAVPEPSAPSSSLP